MQSEVLMGPRRLSSRDDDSLASSPGRKSMTSDVDLSEAKHASTEGFAVATNHNSWGGNNGANTKEDINNVASSPVKHDSTLVPNAFVAGDDSCSETGTKSMPSNFLAEKPNSISSESSLSSVDAKLSVSNQNCNGVAKVPPIEAFAFSGMALNVAYESLESMRKANLEVEFGAACDFDQCLHCLRTSGTRRAGLGNRLKKLASKRWKSTPCLLCASPVCAQHSMESFRKENISICCDCAPLFSHDFIVGILDITVSERDCKSKIDHMVDVYDRAVLMLKYSSQYIDSIADALDHNTKRNNQVGLGSSATGLVSGITGVVGAATIFTPVGPPLLIASLFFGGSATAVQTGSEAVNYFSEPNKLADKIIALHAMVVSLLETVNMLQNALLREQVRPDQFFEGDGEEQSTSATRKITRNAGVVGVQYASAASGAAAASRAGVFVGRESRLISRASTTAVRTARFARFAGGALSAASVVIEAREMSTTIKNIRNGNPCEKAELIRCIKDDLAELPDTSILAEECERYFVAMTSRPVPSAALLKKGDTKGKGQSPENVNVLDALNDLERSTTTLIKNDVTDN
eukprot:CAMPEP_0197438818 /NCGR_PEP_ID=MMETSP1175-20131217/5708_1 /TAXON_ID=1003142 /ORGANISM="Triceratium dubium, Strain CCMP147" /LENGTH=577 /DNA_ID=CAMNT_0042968619 /DNA_START=191 /DNA_END=1924 /DNA_ORIENTATION=+